MTDWIHHVLKLGHVLVLLLHHGVVINVELLLILDLIFDLLLYGVLHLILLDLVQFHGVLHDLLDEGASIEDLGVHVTKEELHFVQLLGHLLDSVAQAEKL